MNQDRLLWCLQKAHELISSRSEESINLDSYGNDKRGCVATICCLSPEFNEIGLFNGRESIKQNHPYPATANHLNFAPNAIGETFQDPEAFTKYCAAFGNGKWDHLLMKKGESISHKHLALLRLERGIAEATT